MPEDDNNALNLGLVRWSSCPLQGWGHPWRTLFWWAVLAIQLPENADFAVPCPAGLLVTLELSRIKPAHCRLCDIIDQH
jgi:hypothetical protein